VAAGLGAQLQPVSHRVIASRRSVYCHSAHFAPQLIRIKALLCTRRTIRVFLEEVVGTL
jgi:hypothetical protein